MTLLGIGETKLRRRAVVAAGFSSARSLPNIVATKLGKGTVAKKAPPKAGAALRGRREAVVAGLCAVIYRVRSAVVQPLLRKARAV